MRSVRESMSWFPLNPSFVPSFFDQKGILA